MPELAAAEYMGRKPAYSALKPGMIVPLRNKNTDETAFFEVKNGIDEKGFAVFILKGATPQNKNQIRVLCRGTVPSDKDSCIHNLAKASGLDQFEKHKDTILNMITDACREVGNKVYLEFNGHSQGAAISQHACSALAQKMKSCISESIPTPLTKLQKINIAVWNPPATTEAIASQFSEDAAFLAKHPASTNCLFDFTYGIVDTDVVSKCGEVFLGRFRKSYNVSCQTVHFDPPVPHTVNPILGPHCTPVLVDRRLPKYADRTIKCTRHIDDNRVAAFGTQKYLELLKFLKIMDLQIDLDSILAGLPVKFPSDDSKKTFLESQQFLALKNKDIVDLEVLKSKPDQIAKSLNLTTEEFGPVLQNLIAWKKWKSDYDMAQVLCQAHAEEIQIIRSHSVDEYNQLILNLEASLKELESEIQVHAERINKDLESTTFKSLTNTDQYTVGHLLNWSKTKLYNTLDSSQPATTRISDGAQLILLPTAAAVGTGIAIVEAPITALLVVYGFATSVGLGMAVKRMKS